MKYKELCNIEGRMLSSGRESLFKQGLGLRDIIKMYKEFHGFYLSEEMLLSDLAKKYIKSQMQEFKYGRNDTYKYRIKGASRLVISSVATPSEVYEVLNEAIKEPCTLEQARDLVRLSYLYTKMAPEIFINVYNQIKEERGWE